MAQAFESPLIPVAAATPAVFELRSEGAITVEIRFYQDAKGELPLGPAAGGSRDVVIEGSRVWRMEGVDPAQNLTSAIADGTFTADGATPKVIGLGLGFERVTIAAAANAATSPVSTHYRILVLA